MPNYAVKSVALQALRDPSTPAGDLARIAVLHPSMQAQVAAHRNVDAALLARLHADGVAQPQTVTTQSQPVTVQPQVAPPPPGQASLLNPMPLTQYAPQLPTPTPAVSASVFTRRPPAQPEHAATPVYGSSPIPPPAQYGQSWPSTYPTGTPLGDYPPPDQQQAWGQPMYQRSWSGSRDPAAQTRRIVLIVVLLVVFILFLAIGC